MWLGRPAFPHLASTPTLAFLPHNPPRPEWPQPVPTAHGSHVQQSGILAGLSRCICQTVQRSPCLTPLGSVHSLTSTWMIRMHSRQNHRIRLHGSPYVFPFGKRLTQSPNLYLTCMHCRQGHCRRNPHRQILNAAPPCQALALQRSPPRDAQHAFADSHVPGRTMRRRPTPPSPLWPLSMRRSWSRGLSRL